VTTPAEIDVTTAEQLQAVLMDATSGEHPVIVVDMSLTQFCDSAGLNTVLRAHKRVLAEGRELRLVIGVDGAVPRIFMLTGIDRHIPCFASLKQALDQPPGAATHLPGAPGPDVDEVQAGS